MPQHRSSWAKNVVAVCMDGACKASFPLIQAVYPHVQCFICPTHSLDNFLKNVGSSNEKITIKEQGEYNWGEDVFAAPLSQGWEVIKFITNHPKPLARYRDIAESGETWAENGDKPIGGIELLKYGETRYALRVLMAQRLSNVEPVVVQLVGDAVYTSWLSKQKASVKEAGAALQAMVQDADFWTSLRLTVRVLEPCLKVLRLSDGKKGVTLGKLYHLLIDLDNLYGNPIAELPERVRKKMHKLFMGRWEYFDTPVFAAAYVSHSEFLQVNHSVADEAKFKKVLQAMATEEHSYNAMNVEWSKLKTSLSIDEHGMCDDEAFSDAAKCLQPFEWVRTYLIYWPHLQWALMRLSSLQCSASACEHSWSIEGWIHSKKRNRLGQKNVERLVRAHTNLILEAVLEDWEAQVLPWDIELLIEEPC